VITDPVLRDWIGPLRRQSPPPRPQPLESADVVVLSHLHRDHLDLPSLRRFPRATPVIVSSGAGSLVARKSGASEVLEVTVGDEISIGEVTITAVPASHDARRDRWGISAPPLGYVIASARRRVYFAGDTGLFREMADLRPLDLALLPVWGWGPRLGRATWVPPMRPGH
jgi:L-ascorbate metabolism protein UlaG (beta-lactamase superfamily)